MPVTGRRQSIPVDTPRGLEGYKGMAIAIVGTLGSQHLRPGGKSSNAEVQSVPTPERQEYLISVGPPGYAPAKFLVGCRL